MIIVLCLIIYLLGVGITEAITEDIDSGLLWPVFWIFCVGSVIGKKIKESLDKASK